MKTLLLCVMSLTLLAGTFALERSLNIVSSQVRNEENFAVRVYNVDDVSSVYVNGREIGRVTYTNARTFDITHSLRNGSNIVRLTVENYSESYTYGFEIIRNGEVVFAFECGLLNNTGCSKNTQSGVVFDKSVTLTYTGTPPSNRAYNAVNFDSQTVSNRVYMTNAVSNAARAAGIAANAAANAIKPVKLGGVPRVTPKVTKGTDSRARATISVRYPEISNSGAAADFNAKTEQLIRRHILDFKRDLSCSTDTPLCELDISYKVTHLDNRVISIGYWASTNTWGAHPNSYSFVFNYDLGTQVTISR